MQTSTSRHLRHIISVACITAIYACSGDVPSGEQDPTVAPNDSIPTVAPNDSIPTVTPNDSIPTVTPNDSIPTDSIPMVVPTDTVADEVPAGMSTSINGWDTDDVDNGGTAE